MSERIAGKTFSTPEEAGITPPTKEELARAEKIFDEFEQRIDAIALLKIELQMFHRNSGMILQELSTNTATKTRVS